MHTALRTRLVTTDVMVGFGESSTRSLGVHDSACAVLGGSSNAS
jgi:hypothetical protein